MPVYLKEDKEDVIIKIHVNPGAKKNGVAGEYGDSLSLKINAPAVDGKANKALVGYVADLFDVRQRQVEVAGGEKSRQKTIRIKGLSASRVKETIDKLLAGI